MILTFHMICLPDGTGYGPTPTQTQSPLTPQTAYPAQTLPPLPTGVVYSNPYFGENSFYAFGPRFSLGLNVKF